LGEDESSSEDFTYLNCHIDQGGISFQFCIKFFVETNDLLCGLQKSMSEAIESVNDSGQKVTRVKNYRILESPRYLFVNFMRFFWKQKEGVKAKILKVRLIFHGWRHVF
jgi:hypothetical protein